jgi:hypothetical protein
MITILLCGVIIKSYRVNAGTASRKMNKLSSQ